MAKLSLSTLPFVARTRMAADERPVSSVAYDGLIVALSAWFLGGLYLDGWAHQHIPTLETFFTPWHAVFYSGFFALAGVLVPTALLSLSRAHSWRQAMPVGYELSLAGVFIFMIGGVLDLIWHTLFGIEADVEALLSPTHLVLALGGVLIVTGPLRAAWQRTDSQPRGALRSVPMVLSLTFIFSVLTFFTQYAHPFGATLAANSSRPVSDVGDLYFYAQALGILSILIQSAIWMGLVLFAIRRWTLPFGSLTLMLTSNVMLMALMRDGSFSEVTLSTGVIPLVGVAFVAGLAADVLLQSLKPSAARPFAFRLFAFAVPTILYALYFAALILVGGGIWWTIHLWAGVIFMAGVVGFLLSYAFVPPTIALEPPRRS
jgi:hypothetical protein